MSYDIELFPVPDGVDPVEHHHRQPLARSEPDPHLAQRLGPLIEQLGQQLPHADRFESPSHIELSDDRGIQVSLFANAAAVTVAYWHDGEKAETCIELAYLCAHTIHRHTGYIIYDPQLDRVIDAALMDDACQRALTVYETIVRSVTDL